MTTARNYKLKRLLDLCIGMPLLIVAGPLMLAISVLSALILGPPILFRQQRPGLNGDPFTILKFRTMTDGMESNGDLLPDSERVTWLGRLLRSTSLDELPELINVIRGEMSIVGPRPLLVRYLDRYSPCQMRRHEVRPGITGWAQVNGRNAVTWDQKFAMDVWYVEHQSLWLDLKIIALTVVRVVKRVGIDQPGAVGSSEFMGNNAAESSEQAPGVHSAR